MKFFFSSFESGQTLWLLWPIENSRSDAPRLPRSSHKVIKLLSSPWEMLVFRPSGWWGHMKTFWLKSQLSSSFSHHSPKPDMWVKKSSWNRVFQHCGSSPNSDYLRLQTLRSKHGLSLLYLVWIPDPQDLWAESNGVLCLYVLGVVCYAAIYDQDTWLEISYTYEECHWAALAHSAKPNPKSYWGPRVHERQYEEK